jgi:hypothetical protein
MRPRTISLLLTLGIFLGGLALVWGLGSGGGGKRRTGGEQAFTFPLNNTMQQVQVLSTLRIGHMTPQDDQVELTLGDGCLTAHLYAYLSNGWDHGPVDAAALILGEPLHSNTGPTATLVRHDAVSALVIDGRGGRGVLVRQASPRSFNTLLVEWSSERQCSISQLHDGSRKLGRLFDTFRVVS